MSVILPSFGFFIFWILIIVSYVVKADKKRRDSNNGPAPGSYPARERAPKPAPAKPAQTKKAPPAVKTPAGKVSAAHKTPSTFREKSESYIAMSAVLSEDRKHDWMARQLAEEERALRRNFSDLGALHDASCAADDLKKSHHHVKATPNIE